MLLSLWRWILAVPSQPSPQRAERFCGNECLANRFTLLIELNDNCQSIGIIVPSRRYIKWSVIIMRPCIIPAEQLVHFTKSHSDMNTVEVRLSDPAPAR